METRWLYKTSSNFAELREESKNVCVIPMGCVEKHGLHLALGTDILMASHVAFAASQLETFCVFPDFTFGDLPCNAPIEANGGSMSEGNITIPVEMELQLLEIEVSVLRAGAVKTGMLGASTTALDRFCDKTELYSCNATRFKSIVESVEARCISVDKIAKKSAKILGKRSPRFAYSINRNPLLLLLNSLPKRLQLKAIKTVLKNKKEK